MISIVIPAKNEEAVIERGLQALKPGLKSGEFEVIVVANACSDNTVEAVRRFGCGVKLLETSVGGKANALNMGDEAATGFPRLYLDADVTLDAEAVRLIASALEGPGIEAAAPNTKTDTMGCGWAVRAFYRIWTDTPYFKQGMIGCGVYALNQLGRSRFGKFPNVIADDRYVRAQFSDGRIVHVRDAEAVVKAPRRWWDLVKVMTRSRFGSNQLALEFPEVVAREQHTKDYGGAVWGWIKTPGRWIDVAVYVTTNFLCRLRAWRQMRQQRAEVWERDLSTRGGA